MFIYTTIIYIVASLILFNIAPSGSYNSELFYPILFSGLIVSTLYLYLDALYIYIVAYSSVKRLHCGFSDTIKYFIDHFLDLKTYLIVVGVFNLFSITLPFMFLAFKVSDQAIYYALTTIVYVISFIIEYILRPRIILNSIGNKYVRFTKTILYYTIPWFIISVLFSTLVDGLIYTYTHSMTSLYPYFHGFDKEALQLIEKGYVGVWIPTYGKWFATILIALYTQWVIKGVVTSAKARINSDK